MPSELQIYSNEAERYEALVAREDCQGNIPRALSEIVNVNRLNVLDLGAGTGRLSSMIAPRANSLQAFDASTNMLKVARDKLQESGLKSWGVAVAEHRRLPIPSSCADLILSGWSVSYLAVWNPASWREALDEWFVEAKRALRPDGLIVLFESLGTGNESPVRLTHLENFYQWLDEKGFNNEWIRTDYQFESIEEAERLSRFFFGDALGDQVRDNSWVILPECTGVWWRKA